MIRGLGEDAEFRIRHEFILFLAYHFGSSFFLYLGAGWPSLLRSKYLYFFLYLLVFLVTKNVGQRFVLLPDFTILT